MFGALKRGFRSMASLILVTNVVGELNSTEKNTCSIARFPCGSTAFCIILLLSAFALGRWCCNFACISIKPHFVLASGNDGLSRMTGSH